MQGMHQIPCARGQSCSSEASSGGSSGNGVSRSARISARSGKVSSALEKPGIKRSLHQDLPNRGGIQPMIEAGEDVAAARKASWDRWRGRRSCIAAGRLTRDRAGSRRLRKPVR